MKVAKPVLLIALMVIVPGLTVFWAGTGQALDGKAGICPQCNQDGTWTVPSNGGTGPIYVPSVTSPEQIRAAERDRLNDLGLAAKGRGDLDAAISYFQEALKSNPTDEAVRRDLGVVQNNQAIRIWERGDYAATVALLEAAVQNYPDDDVIRGNLTLYRKLLNQQQQEVELQQQLDEAKQVIGGILNNLAEEWGTSNLSGSSGASGGLNFAVPGGAEVAPGELAFMAPGGQTIPPANQDTSVVDLTFMDPNRLMVEDPRVVKRQAGAEAETLRQASIDRIYVPSPSGYKTEAERRNQLARLSDEQIERELARIRQTLTRMQADFENDTRDLDDWLKETQQAEDDALKDSFGLLVGGSLDKFADTWAAYPRLKALASNGLEIAGKLELAIKMADNPTEISYYRELLRDMMMESYKILVESGSEAVSEQGPKAIVLTKFVIDYSYSMTRWGLARNQILAISDNLDNPNGKLRAELAIKVLQEDLFTEHERRIAAAQ